MPITSVWRRALGPGVLLLILAATTACGEESTPDTEPGDGGSGSASWQDTDACSLLTDDQLTPLLDKGFTTEAVEDDPEAPECRWRSTDGLNKVRLVLWQPPVPDIITDNGNATLPVGDRTGYVTGETAASCMLDVAGEPAFVKIEVNSPRPDPPPHFCASVVVPVVEGVLDRLGWAGPSPTD